MLYPHPGECMNGDSSMTADRPLIPLSEAARLLGEQLETIRKRATRSGEIAPGVPVMRTRSGARRYVRRIDLASLAKEHSA